MFKFNSLSKLFLFILVVSVFSCQKNEQTVAPLEVQLSSDETFNEIVYKTMKITDMHSEYVSSLNTLDKKKNQNRLETIKKSGVYTESQLLEVATLLGYKNPSAFLKELNEIDALKQDLHEKFPTIYNSDKTGLIKEAVLSSNYFAKSTGDKKVNVAIANCDGKYSACRTGVAVTAAAGVFMCGPAAPICVGGAVAVALAMNNVCLQDYIGCKEEELADNKKSE